MDGRNEQSLPHGAYCTRSMPSSDISLLTMPASRFHEVGNGFAFCSTLSKFFSLSLSICSCLSFDLARLTAFVFDFDFVFDLERSQLLLFLSPSTFGLTFCHPFGLSRLVRKAWLTWPMSDSSSFSSSSSFSGMMDGGGGRLGIWVLRLSRLLLSRSTPGPENRLKPKAPWT